MSALYSGAPLITHRHNQLHWAVTDLARYAGGVITITGQLDPAQGDSEIITNTAVDLDDNVRT